MIGGKEIEVMGPIAAEDYASGRCFHSAVVSPAPDAPDPLHLKQFTNPMRDVPKGAMARDLHTCKPRHDPSAPSTNVIHLICLFFSSCLYILFATMLTCFI